jgi:phosphotransferase system enzyme I (PtsI)
MTAPAGNLQSNKPREIRLRGAIASPGIAIAACFKHDVGARVIEKRRIPEDMVEAEISRLRDAMAKAREEIKQIQYEADRMVGDAMAKMFEAQLMILDDETFIATVADDISKSKLNAEHIYQKHIQRNLVSLRKTNDGYLREMANDINATAAKVFGFLIGHHANKLVNNKNKIALAEEFSPGEIVLINKYGIPGYATQIGGSTSHMALIAKSLSIPAVVGIANLLERCPDGAMVIIDGNRGQVIVNPADETLTQYKSERRKRRSLLSKELQGLGNLEHVTRDGSEVDILANLELPTDVDQSLASGNVGVGLYRTEFFYLSRMKFPSEADQTQIYSDIARNFFPNPVTMRTFDLGSDKLTGDYHQIDEDNPALGWRGVRFLLDMPSIFHSQIKALLRASEFRNLKIMLPMVSSPTELAKTKHIINSVKRELRAEKLAFDEKVEVGMMVEIPATALMAEKMARHVDFFSIGTNDLIQYTLAADRGNRKVAAHYSEFHPAVLKLIAMTLDAGAKTNTPVSLCGEMAGKSLAVPLLLGMGLRCFSVIPPRVSAVIKILNQLEVTACEELAQRVLQLATAEKVESVLQEWFLKNVGKKFLEV